VADTAAGEDYGNKRRAFWNVVAMGISIIGRTLIKYRLSKSQWL